MSIASKKANKVKKAKKGKLRREKARLTRAKQAAETKVEEDQADGDSEKGKGIPGKPTRTNDWVPLKGKSADRSNSTAHRPQGK